MRVAVDLDGVVYDWNSTAKFLLNHYRNLGLTDSDIDRYDWQHRKCQKEDLDWLWTDGVRRGMFRHGHLFKGSAAAMDELSKMADIVVVSHRLGDATPDTKRLILNDTLEWVAFHRLPVSEVRILEKTQPKSSVPADLYIDDAAYVAEDLCVNTGGAVLLWTRPWNLDSNLPGPFVRRVESWGDVLKEVKLLGQETRPSEAGWAAGFYVGEGCTQVIKMRKTLASGKSKDYLNIRATITGTNREPLDRFQRIVRHGNVVGPYRDNRPNHSPTYRFSANGRRSVLHILSVLWRDLDSNKRLQAVDAFRTASYSPIEVHS